MFQLQEIGNAAQLIFSQTLLQVTSILIDVNRLSLLKFLGQISLENPAYSPHSTLEIHKRVL